MRIDATRTGGSASLHLEGRLDREAAERLSDTLEDLLQEGVRSLRIDFSRVTYASTAVTRVLARWHQELAVLRGAVELRPLSPAVEELLADAGWSEGVPPATGSLDGAIERQSSWHARTDFAASGQYELSAAAPDGGLGCRVLGDPQAMTRSALGPEDCVATSLPANGFAIGVGAIGSGSATCHERLGELIAVSGCAAYFPSDGARMADYLLGTPGKPPAAVV